MKAKTRIWLGLGLAVFDGFMLGMLFIFAINYYGVNIPFLGVKNYFSENPRTAGVYYENTNTIQINPDTAQILLKPDYSNFTLSNLTRQQKIEFVFYHELAHYYWDEKMTRTEKNDYQRCAGFRGEKLKENFAHEKAIRKINTNKDFEIIIKEGC